VVGDPVLREVVRADPLAAVDRTDLGAAGVGRLLVRLLLRQRQQPGAQHPQAGLPVLQLALLVLHRHDGAGRDVGDPDRRVGGVDALPAGPGRTVDVDAQVGRVDLDVDLLRLRQHEHAGRAGVDAPLRLRRRHPLHPVHTALVLELAPHTGVRPAADRHRHVLVAAEVGLLGVEDLGLPALPLGVAQVHPEQVAGEQRRLLAALTGLDLQDHVLAVVGVARHQQLAQLVLQRAFARRQLGRLGGERLVLAGQLAGRRQVALGGLELVRGLRDPGQLRVPAAEPPGQRLVGVHGRVGELALQLGVLGQQRGQALRGGHRGLLTTNDAHPAMGWASWEALLAGALALAVPLLEPGDAAAGVEDLLLAGVERVALRAHVGVDHAVRRGAAGLERVPAGAGHRRLDVVRVDSGLHEWVLSLAAAGSHPWSLPRWYVLPWGLTGGWPPVGA
jgi:hypothetical protein